MSYVSLAKYTLKDDLGVGQSWQLPASVTASIDLTPPALDGVVDNNPLTNHAICLSDSPLDSNDLYHSFGTGNVAEMQMQGLDRDAWQSITGYRPAGTTIANCLAEHLLRSPGEERVNPLTCGFNRGLDIQLGGQVWSHTLTGLSDPLSLPVLQIEAEGLATIYREQGETQYRLSMGGLRRKYDTRPVKELIQYLFPSGRADLPLMDELTPQTTKTETWPSAGTSDQTWVTVTGSWSITTGKVTHTQVGAGLEYYRLNYAFGGSDRDASTTLSNLLGSIGYGVVSRGDTSGAAIYFAYVFNAGSIRIYKRLSGTNTQIADTSSTPVSGNTFGIRTVGSNNKAYKNGSVVGTAGGYTDTAIASGLYSLLLAYVGGASFGGSVFDDLISGGGGGFQAYWVRRQNQIIGGGTR